MEIYTSCWKNRELAGLACMPVQISRGRPRGALGFRYRVLRELAPDDRTWAEEDWSRFGDEYRRQLEELGVEAIVSRLETIGREAGGLPVTLLCFEEAQSDCHRGLLASWLRERGVEVRELQPGDLPEREGALEPRLF